MRDSVQNHSVHEPVLLHEVVQNLMATQVAAAVQKSHIWEKWYLDGTLGGAGHALAIAKAVSAAGGKLNIIGLDRDMQAIERAKVTLAGKAQKLILENENFRNLDKVLDMHAKEIVGEKVAETAGESADKSVKVDLILLDLGISSDELDNSGRGFTFQRDEPLLMTMGDPVNYHFTARDILNNWDENVIADVIYGYGEERFARRIARNIVQYRAKKKIETSGELAEIVKSAVPTFYGRGFGGRQSKIHPATKTFQALRIAVNDELKALKEGLAKGYERLNNGGRMAVISFHSLEDRIVKDFYKEKAAEKLGKEDRGALIITKKPITASTEEKVTNPRSRSAKMRVIEKLN